MNDDHETAALPHDRDAEMVVLGSMLISPTVIDDLVRACPPGFFYVAAHQSIAEVLYDLRAEGRDTGPVAVNDELMRRRLHGRTGGGVYLTRLMESAPNSASAGYYADIVRAHMKRRRLMEVGTRLYQMGSQPDTDLDDVPALLDAAVKMLTEELEDPSATVTPVVGDLFAEVLDDIADPKPDARVPTGIHDLDRLVSGWGPGQLIVIAARPSVGKSTLGLGAARHAAIRAGVPTLLCTLEMGTGEIMRRLISAEAKVNLHHITNNECDEGDWARITGITAPVTTAPLYIDETPAISLPALRHTIATLNRKRPLGLVVVDYLQLMSTPKAENRQLAVSQVSAELKTMAKEFQVPIVALAQLNRGPEGRADKRPVMSDLRESGAIENDADVVILMHREDYYDPETIRAGECELIVAKNRNGPKATAVVAFQGHYSRCVDMAREDGSWTPSSALRDAA